MLIEPQWIVLGGALTVVGAVVLVARAVERKRREAYESYCLMRGFQFAPGRPAEERRFSGVFQPFEQGRRRAWGYTIAGRLHGFPFTAFEYKWVTGSGRNSSTHHLGGMVWERDGVSLPTFALSPEAWFTRLGELFGMQDIDFDESPEFSRSYRLKGASEAEIRTLFTPDLRHFFAATPDQRVAGGGRFLFWWKDGRLPPADGLDEWLEAGDRIRRRFFKE